MPRSVVRLRSLMLQMPLYRSKLILRLRRKRQFGSRTYLLMNHGKTQGEKEVLTWIPQVLHDCSAWRNRFAFVSSREAKPRLWCLAGSRFEAKAADGFWDQVGIDHTSDPGLTLVRTKKQRHLLLYLLNDDGQLIHLASGMVVSTLNCLDLAEADSDENPLVLVTPDSRDTLRWFINQDGELQLACDSKEDHRHHHHALSVSKSGRMLLGRKDESSLGFELQTLSGNTLTSA
eukprot:TRINITY_DN69867_c0_g1_i1.p1 TRINITY_DN69867_c0_g1~~TRINITY_DN69867_c0_g1_i1.p1  ORF type:complete len:232 (+),score=39.50 TRINITY_DN69867_c0_g1_i1:29-724(+)